MHLITTGFALDMTSQQEELIQRITEALTAYETRRVEIVAKAFEEGGNDLVQKVEDEYIALRDARREIRRHQLDENHEKYQELTDAAIAETKAINVAVARLESAAKVMNQMAGAISILGRVLIILG